MYPYRYPPPCQAGPPQMFPDCYPPTCQAGPSHSSFGFEGSRNVTDMNAPGPSGLGYRADMTNDQRPSDFRFSAAAGPSRSDDFMDRSNQFGPSTSAPFGQLSTSTPFGQPYQHSTSTSFGQPTKSASLGQLPSSSTASNPFGQSFPPYTFGQRPFQPCAQQPAAQTTTSPQMTRQEQLRESELHTAIGTIIADEAMRTGDLSNIRTWARYVQFPRPTPPVYMDTSEDDEERGGLFARFAAHLQQVPFWRVREEKLAEELRWEHYQAANKGDPEPSSRWGIPASFLSIWGSAPTPSEGTSSGAVRQEQSALSSSQNFEQQQTASFGSQDFEQQQPASFGSQGFEPQHPSLFGSEGFGQQQPASFSSQSYKHQQPTSFGSRDFEQQQPASFGSQGFGQQQPASFGSQGFEPLHPSLFGSEGFGQQQPASFSSQSYKQQQPTSFGSQDFEQQPSTSFSSQGFGQQQSASFGSPDFGQQQSSLEQSSNFGQQKHGFGEIDRSGFKEQTNFVGFEEQQTDRQPNSNFEDFANTMTTSQQAPRINEAMFPQQASAVTQQRPQQSMQPSFLPVETPLFGTQPRVQSVHDQNMFGPPLMIAPPIYFPPSQTIQQTQPEIYGGKLSDEYKLALQLTDHTDHLGSNSSLFRNSSMEDLGLRRPTKPVDMEKLLASGPTTSAHYPTKFHILPAAIKTHSMYEGLQEEIDACRKVKLVHQRRLILKKKDLEPIPKYVGEDLNDITATQPPQSHKSTREETLQSQKSTQQLLHSISAYSSSRSSSIQSPVFTESTRSSKKRSLKKTISTITLKRRLYYTIPPISELKALCRRYGKCLVKGFTVGRLGYGSVYFPDEVDVSNLNLDEIVHFRYREITLYPDESKKPPVGQGLNRPACVTFDAVYPFMNGKSVKQPDDRLLTCFIEQLLEVCQEKNMKFLEYRVNTGSFVFEVEHFSGYTLMSLIDDLAIHILR